MSAKINQEVEVLTDSATIVLFDPEGLNHRVKDNEDWFSQQRKQQKEIQAGRLIVVPTEMDGCYRVRITTGKLTEDERDLLVSSDDSYWLEVRSGKIHCTAGERLPGGNHRATSSHDQILEIPPGTYRVGLHGLRGESIPGKLPYLVVHLEQIPKGGQAPASKKAPELWPRPKSDRKLRRKKTKGRTLAVPGHRLPEDGDAELVVNMASGMVVLFDPDQLAHCVDQSDDWIADESGFLEEAQLGHVAFVFTLETGLRPAEVRLTMQPLALPERSQVFRVQQAGWVKVSSGKLFCGSDDDLPSNGEIPDENCQGYLKLANGSYSVEVNAIGLEDEYPVPRFIIRLISLGDQPPPQGPTSVKDIYE